MFELLAAAMDRQPLGGGAASFLVHATLIAGAVIATLQPPAARGPAHVAVRVVYTPPPVPDAPPPPVPSLAGLAAPAIGAPRLAIPTTVPTVIPPPARVPFDPSLFAADSVRVERITPAPAGTGPGDVYAEQWVPQPPEMIAHPAVRYPELLRQAGVEGRVVVEAVIDTSGRVEPGSVTVVLSSNPRFDAPARDVVAASRFRPGRINGRPVRVRVHVPVAFQVSPKSPMM